MAKILVVDDTEITRTELGDYLQKAGHQVIYGSDGASGLAQAETHGDIDLIVSDYNMPEMDGLTMLQRIRALSTHRTTPSFMLTTESSPGLKAQGKECGVKAWIIKPCSPDLVLAAAVKVLGIAST
jgi:two-component system chemotaxis response regulator CheY